ncbi:response regulator transcription factor [Streptomyces sp. 7-21]|uniref:response regulator transcription factor n=1 Tax=Streptomyces sp. 7-21 TaxID=2802283 RepID=UPI00191E14EA|nr:response regulator transcription factor [Streptomyces sp. 7-21]MBL1068711.1 response regulator transcription factor [Streptomyces sp. 7-21]
MQQGAITRVLIVNDRAVTRAGYHMLFDRNADFAVAGEAADVSHALSAISTLRPDVVLVDAHPQTFDVVDAVRRLTHARDPGTAPVLVLIDAFDERANRLLRAGARGLLLSQASPAEILAAVRLIAAGYALVFPHKGRGSLDPAPVTGGGGRDASHFSLDHLTRREADVLRLIARGFSNAEISAALFVSESTVKSHVQRMLVKLELRNRVHAVIYAYEAGLVRSGAAWAPA